VGHAIPLFQIGRPVDDLGTPRTEADACWQVTVPSGLSGATSALALRTTSWPLYAVEVPAETVTQRSSAGVSNRIPRVASDRHEDVDRIVLAAPRRIAVEEEFSGIVLRPIPHLAER
jgi:hypothetical protein